MDFQVYGVPVLVFSLATLIKILLIPAYKSTDFEVHRNWLAITHTLPLSRWYYEDTSEWTLDYPPFFAWFEWAWSQVARAVDPAIVRVESLGYNAPSCVLMQRFSVITSDALLLYAVIEYCKHLWRGEGGVGSAGSRSVGRSESERREHLWWKCLVFSLLVLLNCGLLLVDHIHFQYNGFLFGMLLLSVTRMLQGCHLQGGFIFAVLLNFKHLFLYVAPAYFVYLLKHYCFHGNLSSSAGRVSLKNFSPSKFLSLGLIVGSVFALSFGPFLYLGQMGQVLSRLFPFKRGLCHSYWAPNVWALYNLLDTIVASGASRLGLVPSPSGAGGGGGSSMTSGLVGKMGHQLLPNVPPIVTMAMTLLAMSPALVRLWTKPSGPRDFLKCLLLCGYASFLFGWHVHEKAILLVSIPMCILAVESSSYSRTYFLLSTTAHVSLFPLFFLPAETPIKVVLLILYSLLCYHLLPAVSNSQAAVSSLPETLYLCALGAVQLYCLLLHGLWGFLSHLTFLPLLLTSVTCAVGIVWSWGLTYSEFISSQWKPKHN